MYNITREAKKEMDEDYGLGQDKLDNIYTAANIIKNKDLEERKKISKNPEKVKEETELCLGILQYLVVWPVFKMYLFSRKSLFYFLNSLHLTDLLGLRLHWSVTSLRVLFRNLFR